MRPNHDKIPDGNNVYGHVVAPHGLLPVLQAVKMFAGNGRASIYKSQFDGAETLRLSTDTADFESSPLEDGSRHLLTGGVAGTPDEIMAFATELSGILAQAGIEHRFEIYDDDRNLIHIVPE